MILLHRTKRDDALGGIRRLAPVFLELIIEKDEERGAAAKAKLGLWRALAGVPMQPLPFVERPQYDGSITAAADRNALITRDMFLQVTGIPNATQKADEDYRAKLLAATGLVAAAPLVRNTYVCDMCGVSENSDDSVAVRDDGVARCRSCHFELEAALATGCTCEGCMGIREKRAERNAVTDAKIATRAPLKGSIISANYRGV